MPNLVFPPRAGGAISLLFLFLLASSDLALSQRPGNGRPPPPPHESNGDPQQQQQPPPPHGDGDDGPQPPPPHDDDGGLQHQVIEAVTCTKAPVGQGGFGIATPCGVPIAQSPQESDLFQEPKQVVSVNGVASLHFKFKVDVLNATEFTVNARRWCSVDDQGVEDCSLPSPTIVVNPGDLIQVTIDNEMGDDPTASQPMNTLRNPNSTNLHTHGLHVDPAIDNVLLSFSPGESHTWNIEIPSDHAPGLHWYHSHLHGASAYHVQTGLVGAIIVNYTDDSTVPPNYQSLSSHQMVVTHHSLCSCNPTSDPFRIISIQDLATEIHDQIPLSPVVKSNITDVILVNGLYQPVLDMVPGQWYEFQIVNTVSDVYLELEIRDSSTIGKGNNKECQMLLMAIDGIFLKNGPRPVDYFLLSISGRVSLAVMCSQAGTFYFQSNPQGRAADYEAEFVQNLVTLQVSGNYVDSDQPNWKSGDITFPYYLDDLTQTTPDSKYQSGVEESAIPSPAGAWLGTGLDCTMECEGRNGCPPNVDPNEYGQCPYIVYGGASMSYRHVGNLCEVQELTLQGRGKTPHPIHIHVNHFQVISSTNPDYLNYWGEIGDWRDTMPALAGSNVVRFIFDRYGGQIIQHCHYLYHEDRGMMDRMWAASSGDSCTAYGGGNTTIPVTMCTNVPDSAYQIQTQTIEKVCGQ